MSRKKTRQGKRRRRSSKRRSHKPGRWQDRRNIIQEVIEAKRKPCEDCGFPYKQHLSGALTLLSRFSDFPHWIMDFDHRPGVKKRGNVSAMARDPAFSAEDLRKEIAKCDVVCSNCHRDRTYERNYNPDYIGLDDAEKRTA